MPTLVMIGSASTQATSPGGERGFERGDVVELDHLGELRQVAYLADQGGIDHCGLPPSTVTIGVVHRAVIAMVEDEDLVAAGDGAAPA